MEWSMSNEKGKGNHDEAARKDDVGRKIRDLIAEALDVEEKSIVDGASFIDDLGADSLDIVELVMAFEKEFNIEIPDEDAEKIGTVGDAIDYITTRLH